MSIPVKVGNVYSCTELREYVVVLDKKYYPKWDFTNCDVLYLLSGQVSNMSGYYIMNMCKRLT